MVLPLWAPERMGGGGSPFLVRKQPRSPDSPKAGCVHAQRGPSVPAAELCMPNRWRDWPWASEREEDKNKSDGVHTTAQWSETAWKARLGLGFFGFFAGKAR